MNNLEQFISKIKQDKYASYIRRVEKCQESQKCREKCGGLDKLQSYKEILERKMEEAKNFNF